MEQLLQEREPGAAGAAAGAAAAAASAAAAAAVAAAPSSQAAAGDRVEICRVRDKYWILTRHCIFVSHPPAISSSLLCAVSKLKIRTTNRRNALQHIMRYERSAV